MKIYKYLLFASFLSFLVTSVVHGQNQTGFISLDCGIPQDAEYYDEVTGIYYSSDASFIESGVNNNISSRFKSATLDQQFHVLRSFPQGARNCYTLLPARGKGNKYLIRARFMYGNYDGKGQLPEFDLHLGPERWDTVMFKGASSRVSKEIIHVASSDYIHVCLVNTGRGMPIISALELRPLHNSMYEVTGSLNLVRRLDMGSKGTRIIRYKDDMYDRRWQSDTIYECSNCTIISTTSTVYPLNSNFFAPPYAVMQTAHTISDNSSKPFTITWDTDNSTDQYYLCLHFAEVEYSFFKTREFNVYVNGKHWWGPYKPSYWGDTVYGRIIPMNSAFEILMNKTKNATLSPLINAMEVYGIKELFLPQTDDNDVAAILKVKAMYGVKRNWQGDPCAPKSYIWSGLGCKSDGSDPPRIISVNMASNGLKGLIAPYITNLTMLESLDFSNNNLTGEVPDFLSGLAFLKVLNLKGNNFTGTIPASLLSRSQKGLISLSVDENVMVGNKGPCKSGSCKKKRKDMFIIPLAATIAGLAVLFLAAWTIFWFVKKKNGKVIGSEAQTSEIDGSLEIKNRQFTFLEVQSITNNFERVIGKGGFGAVYYGRVQGTELALKILSPSSSQGYKEFEAEANILINVHHKNLTSLVGYCNEGTHLGLVYEYMANGSLDRHLSDKNPYLLTWKHRLQIALDAAQGLEYLHSGCKPSIVHRDVKTTNILLTEDLQAKISDFGLSRAFPVDGDSYISTVVAGTPGYLDPEYYTSNRLTEKSDVYSFGVVLLEMITSRPPIMRHEDDTTHIIHWVSSVLGNGDVGKIVDKRFRGDFDMNSVWKALELAMVCVSRISAERPTMYEVVVELKVCLAAELARHETGPDGSIGEIPMRRLDSGSGPLAR